MMWDHNVAAAERALGQLRLLGPAMLEEARLARRERGFPTSSDGGGVSGGSVADPTAAAALTAEPAWDAVEKADRAMSGLIEAAARFDGLKKAAPIRGRVNTVELCSLCGEPAPVVHRVDGKPYHASSCYYKMWRARDRAS